MKSLLAISLLVTSTAFAIRGPTGLHTTLGCKSTDAKKLKVYVQQDNRYPNLAVIKLVTKEGQESSYKGKKIVSQTVGGPVYYQAPIMAGMLTLSINMTSAPRPGGTRPAVLSSAAYGHVVKTPLMCSTVMY